MQRCMRCAGWFDADWVLDIDLDWFVDDSQAPKMVLNARHSRLRTALLPPL
jgi:hypothetical protein